jgi:hypothetical protein
LIPQQFLSIWKNALQLKGVFSMYPAREILSLLFNRDFNKLARVDGRLFPAFMMTKFAGLEMTLVTIRVIRG